MNIPSDITFWAVCANTIITALGFAIIKFNDFKHLTNKVIELSTEVKGNTKKLNKIDKTLAVQTQRIDNLETKK